MTFPARPLSSHARRAASAAFLAAVFAASLAVAPRTVDAATTTTSTASSMATQVLGWVNQARASKGLRPLRAWSTLSSVATYRAGKMASAGVLSHSIAGSLSSQLSAKGVTAWSTGEDIGVTTYAWGSSAATSLFTMWRNSPTHWAILMSSRYNYIGLGFAYRSSSGATYASVIETESPDHSAPRRWFTGAWRSGTTIGWSWSGADLALQTHTAGLRSYDVSYRRNDGSWVRLRSGTTTRSLSLSGRVHGHTYYLAIRARDWAGNVSSWTTKSIYVP